jgi:4'-phosphopantetheinyl transferase
MLKLRLLSVDIENITFESLKDCLRTLPIELQEKVASLKVPTDRIMSLCTRLLMRQAIAEDLNLPLDSIVLQYGEYGKPYISADVDYHFSVSHCDGLIAFASYNKPIGVDTENLKTSKRNRKIESRLFNQNEIVFINDSPNPNLNFFKVWTRKESYTKMLGLGLNKPFSSFDTTMLHSQGYFQTHTFDDYIVTMCAESISSDMIDLYKLNFKVP